MMPMDRSLIPQHNKQDEGGDSVTHENQKHLDEFNEYVASWLNGNQAKTYNVIINNIRRFLKQQGIKGEFEADDIFTDTYIRTRSKILQGEKIDNYVGWFRIVSLNIVREKARKVIKIRQIIKKVAVHSKISDELRDILNCPVEQMEPVLSEALKELSEEEFEIIHLRYWEGLSWADLISRSEPGPFHSHEGHNMLGFQAISSL